MASVVQLAKLQHWTVYHTYNSQRSEPGFPDLVLVKHKCIFRELKTDKGRITEPQKLWINKLQEAGADAKIWRPKDWDEIEETLIQ